MSAGQFQHLSARRSRATRNAKRDRIAKTELTREVRNLGGVKHPARREVRT